MQAESQLAEGHTDVSFTERGSWTATGVPYGSRTADVLQLWLGDPESGPTLSFYVVSPGTDEIRTPIHFHGTDQFRAVVRGSTRAVGRHLLAPGEFTFQEAGNVYREGAGGQDGELWMVLSLGDRRGVLPVFPRGVDNGSDGFEDFDEGGDRIKEFVDASVNNPGGEKGIPGITTTFGACRQGYVAGSFARRDEWRPFGVGVETTGGVWGHPSSGPLALMVKSSPREVAIPSYSAATDTLCLVVEGSCDIGTAQYVAGEARIQFSGAPSEAIVAGPEGAAIIFLVGDRRALPMVDSTDSVSAAWQRALDDLVAELSPETAAAR